MLRRRSLSDINGKGLPPADLLACFPPRARRRLLPKPVCSNSPARTADPPSHHRHRGRGGGGKGSRNKSYNSDLSSEPTSPKVTCAGQIKVRPKPGPCKNWRSVMEEIERIHNNKKLKRQSVTQFLTCLRNIRFDFRCFGSFPAAEISDEEDVHEEEYTDDDDGENAKPVFSKLFMLLREEDEGKEESATVDDEVPDAVAPANALLLMRCRSAPAKSWQEEREEEEEEEEREREERLVVMRCGEEFSKLSDNIAKETWIGEGIKDILARSRSLKR